MLTQYFSDQESIIIESKCYMPDLEKQEDTRISKETVSYVNEYTWNIFCIYTDLIDDILRRENIPAAIVKKVPPGLGKHYFKLKDFREGSILVKFRR